MEDFGMKNVDLFCRHLEYYNALCFLLYLVCILLPGLVCFTKKIWQTWLGAIC
jgi:hypothetical protein